MFKNFRNVTVGHLVGLALLIGGWLFAINYVGFTIRMNPTLPADAVIYSGSSIAALVMIVLGAYFPEVWLWFMNRKKKDE